MSSAGCVLVPQQSCSRTAQWALMSLAATIRRRRLRNCDNNCCNGEIADKLRKIKHLSPPSRDGIEPEWMRRAASPSVDLCHWAGGGRGPQWASATSLISPSCARKAISQMRRQSAMKLIGLHCGGGGRSRHRRIVGGVRQRRAPGHAEQPVLVGDAERQLLQHALQHAFPDQQGECRQAAAGLDLLDRRAARPRGRPAGDRRRDVHRHAVPQHRLRARPERRRPGDLEVRAQAGSERHRRHVLRHGQPRRGLRRRQDRLRPGRHHRGGARREDRRGRLAGQERRPGQGRGR